MTPSVLVVFFAIFSMAVIEVTASNKPHCRILKESVDDFINNLTITYDVFRQPHHRRRTHVQIEIHIQQITDLSAASGDFELDMFFSEIWMDRRLRFEDMNLCQTNFTLKIDFEDKFWTPNICLWNAKLASTHQSPGTNNFLILYEDGKVWRNHRMILRAPCKFNLGYFPFDAVDCQLLFQSYTYEKKDLTLQWLNKGPVTLMSEVLLSDYFFINYTLDNMNGMYPDGVWDQARVKFFFRRRFGYHLIQTYLPTTLTVSVSWITFFMEAKYISARVTVAVSALLALSYQFGTIEELPRASQLKGHDVWMLLCITFVFLSLVELAFAARVLRWQRRKNLKNITITNFKNLLRSKYVNFNFTRIISRFRANGLSMSPFTANRIDQYAIWLFPIFFAICNICYWIYYLS